MSNSNHEWTALSLEQGRCSSRSLHGDQTIGATGFRDAVRRYLSQDQPPRRGGADRPGTGRALARAPSHRAARSVPVRAPQRSAWRAVAAVESWSMGRRALPESTSLLNRVGLNQLPRRQEREREREQRKGLGARTSHDGTNVRRRSTMGSCGSNAAQ